MTSMTRRTALRLCAALLLTTGLAGVAGAQPRSYYPPPGNWARKAPAELGMDPAALAGAVAYAQAHETERALDFSDQERTFGSLLGSMPTRRAHTNGLVIYKG
ncbi:MAG TPA: serine hydrolase, partial [Telluria sp.]|nr:serine hydrolase [Telluria sp.]